MQPIEEDKEAEEKETSLEEKKEVIEPKVEAPLPPPLHIPAGELTSDNEKVMTDSSLKTPKRDFSPKHPVSLANMSAKSPRKKVNKSPIKTRDTNPHGIKVKGSDTYRIDKKTVNHKFGNIKPQSPRPKAPMSARKVSQSPRPATATAKPTVKKTIPQGKNYTVKRVEFGLEKSPDTKRYGSAGK